MRGTGPLAFGLAIAAAALPAGSLAQSQPHDHTTAAAAAAPAKGRTPAPSDAYVYIGWPNDGETLHTRHIKVWFGTRNFGVAPAGVEKPNTGHHHLDRKAHV